MKKLALIVVMLLCFSGSAFAGKSIVVAVPASVPPFAFIGDDGKLTGYSVDYIKAIAKAADFELILKNVAWSGIFASLVRGDFDAVCGAVTITEKRKKVVDFTEPYFAVSRVLVVRKGSVITNLAELKGKRVGGKIGSIGYQALTAKEDIEAIAYPEVSTLLEALKNGQVEAVVYEEPTVLYYIKKQYQESLKVAAVLDKQKEHIGIAVKKGNSEVLNLLNTGMAAVKNSSVEKEMQKKWLTK